VRSWYPSRCNEIDCGGCGVDLDIFCDEEEGIFMRNDSASAVAQVVPSGPALLRAALEVALEVLTVPACVVDGKGVVLHANQAARRELSDAESDFSREMERALASGHSTCVDLLSIGCAEGQCVLVVDRRLERRPQRAIERAARRWGLTAKQARVLSLLAEGHPNKTIAMQIGCAENTVEYHVTRLLAKAEKESRAELIAALWRSA